MSVIKKPKKVFEKSLEKGIKIFLKKKITKSEEKHVKVIRIFLKKRKKKSANIIS